MPGTADNLDQQSLRGFLHMVETKYPDQLLRITEPIDPRFDMTRSCSSSSAWARTRWS